MSCGAFERQRRGIRRGHAESLVLFALAIAANAHAFGVFARPSHLYVTADAASTLRERIALMPTAEDVAVVATSSFFVVDEEGQPHTRGPAARSLVPWMAIDPGNLVLAAGQPAEIEIAMTVPAFARGSYWGAVLLDVQPLAPGGPSDVHPRVVIPIVVTVRGTEEPRLRLHGVRAFRSSTNDVVVEGTVTNSGNLVIRAPLVVALERAEDKGNVEIASSEDLLLMVFPAGRRKFRITMRGELADDPRMRAAVWIRFGGGPSEFVEAACEVLPEAPCASPPCVDG